MERTWRTAEDDKITVESVQGGVEVLVFDGRWALATLSPTQAREVAACLNHAANVTEDDQ